MQEFDRINPYSTMIPSLGQSHNVDLLLAQSEHSFPRTDMGPIQAITDSQSSFL
jgi:hypothetical protein